MKCEILNDEIESNYKKQLSDNSLITSHLFRTNVNTISKNFKLLVTLPNGIIKIITKYSAEKEFETQWCNNHKGKYLHLNKNNLKVYTLNCNINQSCRVKNAFPNNKKTSIKFKFYRNDKCKYCTSFIGVHSKIASFGFVGRGRGRGRGSIENILPYYYNHSPKAPTMSDGLLVLYRGPINNISYGVMECGGVTKPGRWAHFDYDDGLKFVDQSIIQICADFIDVKNKKIVLKRDKDTYQIDLPCQSENDEWFAAVGFGSG